MSVGLTVASVGIFACANASPVAPSAGAQSPSASLSEPASAPAGAAAATRASAGYYRLSFLDTNLQPVTTLPVGDGELILGARVTDASGSAAQAGRVIFEYCSLKGVPPNDITRADEAPLSACADRSATWASLAGVDVDPSGSAFLDFGVVLIPRTVGFRFRYIAQGSGIANGVSGPADFTWIAAQ